MRTWSTSSEPPPNIGEIENKTVPPTSRTLSQRMLTIVCLEVVLSKGQEWDWLSDAFGRVQVLLALFLIAGAGLVFWELRHASPIVNFRPLCDRNFAISSLIIFLSFGVLYGTSTLLPALLESLFGYDAFHGGTRFTSGLRS